MDLKGFVHAKESHYTYLYLPACIHIYIMLHAYCQVGMLPHDNNTVYIYIYIYIYICVCVCVCMLMHACT